MKKTKWEMAKRLLAAALAVMVVSSGMDCDAVMAAESSQPKITISVKPTSGVNIE